MHRKAAGSSSVPAMRIDAVIDLQGEPGRRYRVVDDFYDGLSYWLTQLAYDDKPASPEHAREPVLALPRNPLPETDLASTPVRCVEKKFGQSRRRRIDVSIDNGVEFSETSSSDRRLIEPASCRMGARTIPYFHTRQFPGRARFTFGSSISSARRHA
jgi:hypothetical protein